MWILLWWIKVFYLFIQTKRDFFGGGDSISPGSATISSGGSFTSVVTLWLKKNTFFVLNCNCKVEKKINSFTNDRRTVRI